jgi:ParB family chromosome partitioning protein
MLGTLAAEDLDADDVRSMLIEQKASVAMAIFPRDRYAGTLTTDLFADEETTYFDDVDQFLALQKEAAEALAEERRKTAAFVEVLCLHSVPWWQYREAEEGEPAGVVINLHPSGAVEVRDGLARHEVEERVVQTTRASPIAPRVKRERPEFTTDLLYYAACQRSAAVQAALLENPRKGKEAVAILLFMGLRRESGLRLTLHAYRSTPPAEQLHRSHRTVEAAASALADELGVPGAGGGNGEAVDGVSRLIGDLDAAAAFDAVTRLPDGSLDRLVPLLPILCFGQEYLDMVDEGDTVFNRIAISCGLRMRSWWTPDAPFLALLTREQLLAVAGEAGAAERFTGMNGWTKKRLVEELAAFFQMQGDAPASEDGDRRAHDWLPGILQFSATKTLNTDAAS